jgi:hypothetical protein
VTNFISDGNRCTAAEAHCKFVFLVHSYTMLCGQNNIIMVKLPAISSIYKSNWKLQEESSSTTDPMQLLGNSNFLRDELYDEYGALSSTFCLVMECWKWLVMEIVRHLMLMVGSCLMHLHHFSARSTRNINPLMLWMGPLFVHYDWNWMYEVPLKRFLVLRNAFL